MGPVQVLSPELVLVDWGPMTLTISAWRRGRAVPVAAAGAARQALLCLAQLSDFQKLMRRPIAEVPPSIAEAVLRDDPDPAPVSGLREIPRAWAPRPTTHGLPPVVGRAVRAALLVGGGLTPLAAVAGAAADQVAGAALGLGADRVIVNNGGDIALAGPDRFRVGLKPPRGEGEPEPEMVGVLEVLPGDRVGGVATSGWQGRSLSPGVADLVTCWATDAATADAAATLVAGRATVHSPVRRTAPARELDAASDLGDMTVTRSLGRLNPDERLAALEGGMAAARDLHGRGLILGCLIRVQGETAALDPAGRLDWPGRAGEGERALAV